MWRQSVSDLCYPSPILSIYSSMHNIILASDSDSDSSLPTTPKATKLVLDIRKLIASESTVDLSQVDFLIARHGFVLG